MKNFKITAKEDGKEYWISRAMAVTGIIRVIKFPTVPNTPNPEIYFLLSKRGPGCPDHVGKWQCTCGYLDFDETLADAVLREVKEELGLDIAEVLLDDPETKNIMPNKIPKILDFRLLEIRDNPEVDSRQNVTFRYLFDVNYDWIKELLDNGTVNGDTESRGGESGEIEEIKLIPSSEINTAPYDKNFAFNHQEILNELSGNGKTCSDPS